MKKLLILAGVAFLASPVSALTYMGPATSNVKQGDLLLGFDYSNSEFDVEWSGYGEKNTLKDVESDLFLAKIGLGLSDGFEFFGRFGLSQIDIPPVDIIDIGDTGNGFAWGFGNKFTLGRKDNLSWGVLFQITGLRADDIENIAGFRSNVELDMYEFQVAIGPSYDVGGFCFYSGPFFHSIHGDVDLDIEILGLTESYDIQQESEFGAYVGLAWNMEERTSLTVEYQSTGDAEAIGVGLIHRFGNTAPIVRQKEIALPRLKSGQESATYTGHIDPRTGEIRVEPVRPKVGPKVDKKGDPIKDKDGNFIFDPAQEK